MKATGIAGIRKKPLFWLSAVLVLTAIFYARIRHNEFTNWDDPIMVTNNNQIKSLSTEALVHIFTPSAEMNEYQPLTTLSYAINYSLFGLNPKPYFLANLFFHLINIALVFFLIYLLVKDKFISLLVAFLFALHPLQVEVVAWVSAHNYVLFGVFFLLTLIFYVKYLQNNNHIPSLLISLGFFILALFSKASAVVLPLTLLSFDYLFKRKIDLRLLLEKIPFFILSFIFGIIALVPKSTEQYASLSDAYGFVDRMFFGFYAMAFYIVKILAPVNLKILYLYPEKSGAMLPFIFYAAPVFILLLVFLLKHNRIEKRKVIFGMLFLLSNVVLILHFIPYWHRGIVTDRYVYIGSIGVFLILGLLLNYLTSKFPNRNTLTYASLSIYVIFMLSVTHKRIDVWKDNMSLWTKEIEVNPKNAVAYNNRGLAKAGLGYFEEAIEDYSTAIMLKPQDFGIYYNRASAKTAIGDYSGAIADYDIPIGINPHNAEAFNHRGLAKYKMGDYTNAINDYNKALELSPNNVVFLNNIGLAKFALGDNNAAIAFYNRAIEVNPNYEAAYYNIGNVYDKIDDYSKALQSYDEAINLNNEYADAFNNRGLVYNKLNEPEKALEDFDRALAYNESLFNAFNNRGKVHVELQNFEAAIADFKKAIDLNHNFAPAYLNKGIAYFYLRNIPKACSNWEKAAALGDNYANELIRTYCY